MDPGDAAAGRHVPPTACRPRRPAAAPTQTSKMKAMMLSVFSAWVGAGVAIVLWELLIIDSLWCEWRRLADGDCRLHRPTADL